MTTESDRSFFEALQNGDEAASQRLFEEYFQRLVGLARQKLRALSPARGDASGAAISALNSFFEGAKRQAFPRLNDRDDLWRLLVVITARKASHAVRDAGRQKRGGGRVRGESVLEGRYSDFNGVAHIIDESPTPEMAAEFAEELEGRLDELSDESLRSVAILKMDGYSNREIARELDCAERTIERKLRSIRRIWSEDA